MALTLGLGACKPLDDTLASIFGRHMRNSVAFDPYENPRPPAEGAVAFASGNFPSAPGEVNVGQPEGLEEDVPPFGPQDMVQPGSALVRNLVNPVPADSASLARGEVLFDRFCSVCHGPQGMSAGSPMVQRMPPMALMNAFNLANGPSVQYVDGYIYGMIRVGRGLMPPYGHQVSHFDRWNLVNYVRQLQRDAGMTPAPDLVGAGGGGG
jgi:mono/diheme cytochrome c family protein